MRWAIVIPVLNEAMLLPGLLDQLGSIAEQSQIIVVDGGSNDGSDEIAARHPLHPTVVHALGGRHQMLNLGLRCANSEMVLFLAADARILRSSWRRLLSLPTVGLVAGCLRRYATTRQPSHRWLDAWAAVRARWTNGAYMDQGPFFRRSAVLAAGGFRAVGAYDTAELGWRLRHRGRFTAFNVSIAISCREYHQRGFFATTLMHQFIRLRYHLNWATCRKQKENLTVLSTPSITLPGKTWPEKRTA